MNRIWLVVLATVGLIALATVPSDGMTATLGEQDFPDGAQPGGPGFVASCVGEVAPFDNSYGSDWTLNFDQTFEFIYTPVQVFSATLTYGIFDADGDYPGDQLKEFSVDGIDLTASMSPLIETANGMTVRTLSLSLPASTYAALSDGTASFHLVLQGPTGPDGLNYNAAGLDFARLDLNETTVPSDVVPNDYDGDGESDQAVFNDQTGRWYIKTLTDTVIAWERWWGWMGAVPVPGDYDNDGKCDLAVCFTNEGLWYAFSLDNGVVTWENQWGWSGAVPVPGDYDGDGQADLAVFNDQNGHWFIKTMTDAVLAWDLPWGEPKDIPLAGDYDGDGTDDLAVFKQDNGYWYIYSLTKGVIAWEKLWGWKGAVPVRGDYDGDGSDDLAVFDQVNGNWYIHSLAKDDVIAWQMHWGWNGAIPVHGDYDGDGAADLAVFNDHTGQWYIITVNGTVLASEDLWGWDGTVAVSGQ